MIFQGDRGTDFRDEEKGREGARERGSEGARERGRESETQAKRNNKSSSSGVRRTRCKGLRTGAGAQRECEARSDTRPPSRI